MQVTQCSLCGKDIPQGDPEVIAGSDGLRSLRTLCAKCGKPILAVLDKQGLVRGEKAERAVVVY